MDGSVDRAGRPAARWRPGHIGMSDVVLVAVAAAIMTVGIVFHPPIAGSSSGPGAFVLAAITAAALLFRARWPRAVLAVAFVAAAVYLAAGFPVGAFFVGAAIAMYSLASRVSLRVMLLAAGLSLAALLAGHLPDLLGSGGPSVATATDLMLWPAVWIGLPAAIGMIVRLGRDERRRTREEETRQVAYEERLRVAREIHDVVGHGLAVINMQAGIALHVIGKRPDQAEVALKAIKTTSKDALEELRGTLAVFRQADGAAPRRPVAGLDQLDGLVKEMGTSGLPVRLEVRGERPAVAGAVNLAAYRIVQESLTNVLRHAGRATATVRVGYAPDAVALEIVDDGSGAAGRGDTNSHGHGGTAPRGGHGITGMRERAAALGGTLEAGPRPDGGFRVHARLPAGETTGERSP